MEEGGRIITKEEQIEALSGPAKERLAQADNYLEEIRRKRYLTQRKTRNDERDAFEKARLLKAAAIVTLALTSACTPMVRHDMGGGEEVIVAGEVDVINEVLKGER